MYENVVMKRVKAARLGEKKSCVNKANRTKNLIERNNKKGRSRA